MSESEKTVVRSSDYRVLFTDNFDIALSNDGVRLQIQQQDPDGFISGLVGLQMSYSNALGLAEGMQRAIEIWEKETGTTIERPKVEVGHTKKK